MERMHKWIYSSPLRLVQAGFKCAYDYIDDQSILDKVVEMKKQQMTSSSKWEEVESKIRSNPSLSPQEQTESINEEHLKRIAELVIAIKNGDNLDALDVCENQGILDGNHRLRAYQLVNPTSLVLIQLSYFNQSVFDELIIKDPT
jgi:hypothetical protein